MIFEQHSDIALSFIGPKIDTGPLPAVFYFALSAQESLTVDPYNQPAVHLARMPMRIFSMDIPGHGAQHISKEALKNWVEPLRRKENIIEIFAARASRIINTLIEQDIVVKEACAVMGLSRGAFIATHVAAQTPAVCTLLGFAPLIKITNAQEFATMKDDSFLEALDLEHLTPSLTDRTVRFYIGNCDTRVGVRPCFDFIEKLAAQSYASGVRSPQVELGIKPSIGFQGHGTAPQTFQEGADWLAAQLGITV
jgi:esterase FrsA